MNESALKERLKKIATEKETTLNKVWKQLLLERFLARLSNSPYQDKFIFKGGLLLAHYININRETIDIDFQMTKIKMQKNSLIQFKLPLSTEEHKYPQKLILILMA